MATMPSWMFPDFMDPLVGFPGMFDPFAPTRRIAGPIGGLGEPAMGLSTVPTGQGTPGRDPFVVGSAGWTRSIPVDFIERESQYLVRADIPGVHKDELHVDVHDGNVLRFGHNPRAEREKEDEEEMGVFHRAERVSSFRNRNLRMPDNADLQGEIKATYHDGVLEILVPKKATQEGAPGRKQIAVA